MFGAIDENGRPKEPVYAFGPIMERGMNLLSGRNHADYVDNDGYCR